MREDGPQSPRAQAEFRFIVRIDEPKRAILCEELRQHRQKTLLIANMLNHIVADDNIEQPMQFFKQENLRCDKVAFRVAVRKEFPSIGYPSLINVNAQSVASHLSKREQIAAVTEAYLPYAAIVTELFELPDIRNKIFPTGLGQFVEVECPVLVTFLHSLNSMSGLEKTDCKIRSKNKSSQRKDEMIIF